MIYIGIYHDHEFNLRIDVNSLSTKPHHCVNQLYEDMVKLKIVDGSAENDGVDEKIDELNQSECDFITLNHHDGNKLKTLLNQFNSNLY